MYVWYGKLLGDTALLLEKHKMNKKNEINDLMTAY